MKYLSFLVVLLVVTIIAGCPFLRQLKEQEEQKQPPPAENEEEYGHTIRRAYGNSMNQLRTSNSKDAPMHVNNKVSTQSVNATSSADSKKRDKLRTITTVASTGYGVLAGVALGGLVGFYTGTGVIAASFGGAMLGGVTGTAVGYTSPATSTYGAVFTDQPTFVPTALPSHPPSDRPTSNPTNHSKEETICPTEVPTAVPSVGSTPIPSSLRPTNSPSVLPSTPPVTPSSSMIPTTKPTTSPTSETPTTVPSAHTTAPSSARTEYPTFAPSLHFSSLPTVIPSAVPSSVSSMMPASQPTSDPSVAPTADPSASLTAVPSAGPSVYPSVAPSQTPTEFPTVLVTAQPTTMGTNATTLPSIAPSDVPSASPSLNPTSSTPTVLPSAVLSPLPSAGPTLSPTYAPSCFPTELPSFFPTVFPSSSPSAVPSYLPSVFPTTYPTLFPTIVPTAGPTLGPSAGPSARPTVPPSTVTPSVVPSAEPTLIPTTVPSFVPSVVPTRGPSSRPTAATTPPPTRPPTALPTTQSPTASPSRSPTARPSAPPTATSTATRAPTISVGPQSQCKKTNYAALTPTKSSICSAFYDIRYQFVVPSDELERSNLFGQAVRLVFHDAGEVDIQNSVDLLGADGCLAQNGDSAGLTESNSLVNTVMEPIWQSVCDRISRADFWVLFGKLVVEAAASAPVSVVYQYGRKDNLACEGGGGRLPDGQGHIADINRVFVSQMGLTVREAVTLMGAHSLGHTHIATSGYGFVDPSQSATRLNAWDLTPSLLDNGYYIDMVRNAWTESLTTDKKKSQWRQNTEPTLNLNADLSLRYAISTALPVTGDPAQVCSPTSVNGAYGCINPATSVAPSTAQQCLQYSNNNQLFLNDFATAFAKMSAVGYGSVVDSFDGATTTGKLGTLTTIDLSTCPYQPPGDPSVRPTAPPTVPPPTVRPTAAPTVKATGGNTRANLCKKTNFIAPAAYTKAQVCSAYRNITSQLVIPTGELARSDLFGQAVRLAFHDAGEVDIQATVDLLGADGCLALTDNHSAGLTEPTSLVNTVMEPIWQSVCDRISRADFWVLFGKLVVEAAASLPITVPFQFGRKDNVECEGGHERLPGGQGDLNELTRVFVNQMGLTLDDAVTLLGAHSLGHVHIANSGYGFVDPSQGVTLNAWDLTPSVLDNGYFIDMIRNTWTESLTTNGAGSQWRQGSDPLLMLNTELAMRYPLSTALPIAGAAAQVCSPTSAGGSVGCANPTSSTLPSTALLIQRYSNNNQLFLTAFATAFAKMSAVGFGGVVSTVDGATTTGKMGTLTTLDVTTCPP